jgi:hypothetical protein
VGWWEKSDAFRGLGLGRSYLIQDTAYLGGYDAHPKPHGENGLLFGEDGVVYERFRKLFVIPWSEVVDVEAQGPDGAQRRITVTRAAAFGVLGATMPKSKKVATIVVQLRSGEQAIFRTSEKLAPEINAKLAPLVSQMHRAEREVIAARAATAPRPAPAPSSRPRMPVTQRDPATLSESEREWFGIE